MSAVESPADGNRCWNCGEPLHAGAAACLWCGASTSARHIPSVLPPAARADAAASLSPGAAPGATAIAQAASLPRGATVAGTPASVGRQVAAFTIDVAAVAVVASAVGLLAGSTLLAALAALECVVFLWVLEARAGLTVGNLACRIRTSRDDRPFSPGAGRSLVRFAVTGAGFVAAVVGAWVVAASGAWDPARRGRSLAARASHTQTLIPPQRADARVADSTVTARTTTATRRLASVGPGVKEPPTGGDDSGEAPRDVAPAAPAAVQPRPRSAAPIPRLAAAREASSAASLPASAPTQASPTPPPSPSIPPPVRLPASPTGASALAPTDPPPASARPQPSVPATPATTPPASATPAPAPTPAPVTAPAAAPAPAPASRTRGEGALLLVFDTGQRAQVALPGTIVLGRQPDAQDAGEHAIAVEDPDRTVSKNHARIEHVDGETWVTDLGSTNGTELLDDGDVTTVAMGQRLRVPDGVRLRIGDRALTVSVLLDGPPLTEGAA